MTDEQKFEQFLQNQTHMVIAVTLEDSSPWVVPVKLQRRDGLGVFEWDSSMNTVHSQAIARGSRVAITLFQPRSETWKECGYCAEGAAEVVEEKGGGFARYRFTAEWAWINDETHVKREIIVSGAEGGE